MDTTPHSVPGASAELDRLERPLPPLPSPESNLALPEYVSGGVANSMPQTELHADISGTRPSFSGPEASTGSDSNGRSEYFDQSSALRNRSQSSANSSINILRSPAEAGALPQTQISLPNEDLYNAGDSHLLSRASSIHGSGAARSLRLNENGGESTPRSRSQSQTLIQALQLPQPARTPPSGSDSDESYRDSPLLSYDSPSQIRRRRRHEPEMQTPRTEFVVPRWQPDAEVTMCPICRTQFSFFVRKHHCRKCGRVVCNACSPHRITIPYQYIVQPPMENMPAGSNAQLDPRRTSSSDQVGSLGGGERVRLCNPCVPDPNTAPPQSPVPHLRQSSQHRNHSRSASTATASYNSPGYYRSREEVERMATSFPRRPREPSILGGRPSPSSTSGRGTSYADREGSLRPDPSESRSRSSTVGSSRDASGMGQYLGTANAYPNRGTAGAAQQPYRPLVPRMDDNSNRALPSRPRQPERRRIPEEDECWLCHEELPSRNLENWERLREEHVNACLAAAMQGSSSPAPSFTAPQVAARTPSFRAESSSNTSQTQVSSSSSTIPALIASTPEARMAAREQAHAAVVFGHSQPTSPGPSQRRTGVFPYQATEKDCVDDAECTICLEEFEVAVEMGRLECFCRFHLRCIRQWFENHPGQCPVHQHGAGY